MTVLHVAHVKATSKSRISPGGSSHAPSDAHDGGTIDSNSTTIVLPGAAGSLVDTS